jgi:hypothetical protein
VRADCASSKREHRVSGHRSFSSGSDGPLASSRFSSATSSSDLVRLTPADPRSLGSPSVVHRDIVLPTAVRLGITLEPPPSDLLSARNRPRKAVQGCVLRPVCAGDARHQPRSKEMTDDCYRRSEPVWWAWLDLNQRPHPYQQSSGERHADRCFPWWSVNVEGQVILCNRAAPGE